MQRITYYVDCLVLNPRAWWYVKHISHPLLIIICRLNNIYKEDIAIENVGTGKKSQWAFMVSLIDMFMIYGEWYPLPAWIRCEGWASYCKAAQKARKKTVSFRCDLVGDI